MQCCTANVGVAGRVRSSREMEDWVLDSLVGFLKSPMWKDPVSKFIDRNCVGKSCTAAAALCS